MIPPYLNSGDKVAIVAPARHIPQNAYATILKIIENNGFVPVRGESTFLEHGPFAGTDNDRAKDLQQMLDNPDIKAIFCLRGGYGSVRIIDKLDFSAIQKHPKWIIGFSDITIFHNKLSGLGIASMHGQMPLNFIDRVENKGLEVLFEVLKGKALSYEFQPNKLNRHGSVSADIVGGNVAILSSLIGTPYDVNTDGKILFIEEVGEYLYRFDRLMHHLKMSGKLNKLAGLIVGGLTDMKDNNPAFGQSQEEIIYDLVREFDYPVAFGFPAGHIKENYPLIFGQRVSFSVDHKNVFIRT